MGKSIKRATEKYSILTREGFLRLGRFLPTAFCGGGQNDNLNLRGILQASGVQFIRRDKPYNRLWEVQMDGWSFQDKCDGTHTLYLLDPNGKRRASIYFWINQLDSTILILPRYLYHLDAKAETRGFIAMVATHGGQEIYRTPEVEKFAEDEDIKNRFLRYSETDKVVKWLSQNYPKWQQLDAYWDAP